MIYTTLSWCRCWCWYNFIFPHAEGRRILSIYWTRSKLNKIMILLTSVFRLFTHRTRYLVSSFNMENDQHFKAHLLASFWKHFLINFHTFSTLTFALIFEGIFDGKWLRECSQNHLLVPPLRPPFDTFFRNLSEHWSRLPAAIVPPPGLGKIVCMRKFARNLIPGSMQECFFTNFCLKNWISPKTSQKETPEGAK